MKPFGFTPFPTGGEPIEGHSIEESIKFSSLFPSIEGLPEEVWKDKKCSNCHEWTREPLCDQGKTFVSADNDQAVTKQHPFGGMFKRGLKACAGADCP